MTAQGLWRWRRILEQEQRSEAAATARSTVMPPKMLQVRVVSDRAEEGPGDGRIELQCPSGYVVKVHGKVHPTALVAVLQAVAQVAPC